MIVVDGFGMSVMRGLYGRGVMIASGMAVIVSGDDRLGVMLVVRRSGVIVVSRGDGRVVMRGLGRRGVIVMTMGLGGRRVILVPMIVMSGDGRVVVVTVSVVVVRLVLVAHDSVPQPLCAVFSGESGIT